MSPIKGVLGRELGYTGNNASRRFIHRICSQCHSESWIRVDSYRELCAICTRRANLGHREQRQDKNLNWKGGTTIRDGYRYIRLQPDDPFYPMTTKDGYVRENRLVMAKKLGRCLNPSEKVHHINGNKLQNTQLNLELVGRSQKHKLSYADAYQDGFRDGSKLKVEDLQKEIRLLRLQVRELRSSLQLPLEEVS